MSAQPQPILEPQINTPLAAIRFDDDGPLIHAKEEYLNPSGSTKDRIARFILLKALRKGRLAPGGHVVEASSGSTSIAMAMVCARLGLRFTAVMPRGVSSERIAMIRAYGGDVHFIDATADIAECVAVAEQMGRSQRAFLPRQFANPDNAGAHRFGTAREALDQLPAGRVDAVVSGVGTGGTLVGLYHGMRDLGCAARPFVARPVASSRNGVLTGSCFREVECAGFSARIPGVVEGMSRLFDPDALDDLVEIEVADEEAIEATRRLIRAGYPVGPSSGLNLVASWRAHEQLREHGVADPVILTVLPDRMERYFSTDLFQGWDEVIAAAPVS